MRRSPSSHTSLELLQLAIYFVRTKYRRPEALNVTLLCTSIYLQMCLHKGETYLFECKNLESGLKNLIDGLCGLVRSLEYQMKTRNGS